VTFSARRANQHQSQVKPLTQKYFCLQEFRFSVWIAHPGLARGALRDRHETLGRDAMDAAGVRRVRSPDEIAGCGRQSRVVLAPRPWRQVGGLPAGDGGKKRRFTGESTKERVKTIARGKPECLAEPVVDLLVCFFCFANEAAGAASARLSLRPLSRGTMNFPKAQAD
jgi:hypothetical protein